MRENDEIMYDQNSNMSLTKSAKSLYLEKHVNTDGEKYCLNK